MKLRTLLLLAPVAAAVAVAISLMGGGGPSSADPAIDAEEQAFLGIINQYRAQNGLGPLTLNTDLNEAADWFSIDMATDNYFPPDHRDNENPSRTFDERIRAFGFNGTATGENIAAGTYKDTAQEIFDQWKASPPHNTNMLRDTWNVMGIARAYNESSQYKWYWTNDFGFLPNLPTPSPTPAVTPPPTGAPTPPPTGVGTQTPKPSPTAGPSQTPTPSPTVGPSPTSIPQKPVLNLPGCTANALPPTDDSGSQLAQLGFTINFFGANYSEVWVNNNGNVTFGSSLSTFTPQPIVAGERVIIAPFWADVDTQGGGDVVRYGPVVFGGRNAFCVNWVNVGYYNDHTDKTNSFQLLIVDRSDTGAGNFDIIMNYDRVEWETGDASDGVNGLGGKSARMGYSNGGSISFEYPGSAAPGSFLDSNPSGFIHRNRDSLINGRYQFFVRNGAPPTGGSISGHVFALSPAPQNVVPNALVQLCGQTECNTSTTNAEGLYSVSGLAAGSYIVRVYAPTGSNLLSRELGPLNLSQNASITDADIVLERALPPPPGTTITSRGTAGEVPLINWREPLQLETTACPGGTASYEIFRGTLSIAGGAMAEGPSGVYKATIPALFPQHGEARVNVTINCPGGSTQRNDFNIYIDPSGVVLDTGRNPIEGATVTLQRSDSSAGPFVEVPAGSPIMSLANRVNPDVTDPGGHFGWDVIAGFYKVRAEKDGCVNPDDPEQAYVETEVLEIPPPVTDLELVLDCAGAPTPTPTPVTTATPASSVSPTATGLPTPTPTATLPPGGILVQWGDVDCNGNVTIGDAQKLGRSLVGLSITQTQPCPAVEEVLVAEGNFVVWGDVDCGGTVSIGDAQKIGRFLVDLSITQTPPCFVVDEEVSLQAE